MEKLECHVLNGVLWPQSYFHSDKREYLSAHLKTTDSVHNSSQLKMYYLLQDYKVTILNNTTQDSYRYFGSGVFGVLIILNVVYGLCWVSHTCHSLPPLFVMQSFGNRKSNRRLGRKCTQCLAWWVSYSHRIFSLESIPPERMDRDKDSTVPHG